MNKKICHQLNRAKLALNSVEGIDCLIVIKPANVTYMTGFLGQDSWAVVSNRVVYLLTDSRYTEQAQTECHNCSIIQRDCPLPEAVAKLLKKLSSVRLIGIEKSASLGDFYAVRKAIKARLKTVQNVIESLRSSKETDEIAAITRAGSIAAKALKRTLPRIKPGVSESELAGTLDFEIRSLGAVSSFETIVAFGANASRPHHQPTKRKLKNTDTILIDFGARYKGYCSDITRCMPVGPPQALYRKVYDTVEQAQAAAIKMVKAGIKIADVDSAAREVIRKSGLPVYGHGTGHGLGLEVHELPVVRAESEGTLKTGEVITIEPAVYMPGKLGVRIEDDCLVTETGCKILTKTCPHDLLP